MDRKLRQQGFTLAEVLIVVTIMAIASAVVVPRMLAVGQMQIQAAGRMIIADLLIAQNDAIAGQTSRRLAFDVSANRYWLADGSGSTANVVWKRDGSVQADGVLDFDEDSRFQGVRLVSVDFGNGKTYCQFDALGTPEDGGTIDIASGQTVYRITIAPLTGRVSIAVVQE